MAMSLDMLLKKALSRHKAHNFTEARSYYLKILRKNPRHLDANYLLGTLCAERNNLPEATRYLERAAQISPDSPMVQNNLGNVHKLQGHFDLAEKCYTGALRANPSLAAAHFGLGSVWEILGKDQENVYACYQTALSLDSNMAEAHQSMGSLLMQRQDAAALRHFERAMLLNPHLPRIYQDFCTACLVFNKNEEAFTRIHLAHEQNPHNILIQYFLAIAEGREPDATIREKYVQRLFDEYSQTFESKLVEKLEYRAPAIARELMEEICGAALGFTTMADLGCGTGLSGLAFRNCVKTMVGMDLSEKMIDLAQKQNCYDRLLQGDIITLLNGLDLSFDLFLATDVVVYFGGLDTLFAALRKRAATGAYFVFSTEKHGAEDSFVVQKTGRFAHSPNYIHALAESCNCTVIREKEIPLRRQEGGWITGNLFVMQFC